MSLNQNRPQRTLNSALETGLRALLILLEAFPGQTDIDRLVFFDYMTVHSGDIEGGPASLHPATPNRSGEVLVRRALIEEGLQLMLAKGLISQSFDNTGILYQASEEAAPFVNYLEAPYTIKLRERARWVVAKFENYSTTELASLFQAGIERWGAEFSLEIPEYEDIG